MYVIKGTIGAGTELLYPAENCTFNTSETSDNKAYEVTEAHYISSGSGHGSGGDITNPILGVISKTGRFTPITR
jgi:hypothetical protein